MGCFCFGEGVGVGSMYDGTGSAHSELGVVSWSLCFGGDVVSMCSCSVGLSRSRRKSARLCVVRKGSVVLLLGSRSVESVSSSSLLKSDCRYCYFPGR